MNFDFSCKHSRNQLGRFTLTEIFYANLPYLKLKNVAYNLKFDSFQDWYKMKQPINSNTGCAVA